MRTFDFIQSVISHNLKDPHSKTLEPDCLSPPLAIMTQSLVGGDDGEGEKSCSPSPLRAIGSSEPEAPPSPIKGEGDIL